MNWNGQSAWCGDSIEFDREKKVKSVAVAEREKIHNFVDVCLPTNESESALFVFRGNCGSWTCFSFQSFIPRFMGCSVFFGSNEPLFQAPRTHQQLWWVQTWTAFLLPFCSATPTHSPSLAHQAAWCECLWTVRENEKTAYEPSNAARCCWTLIMKSEFHFQSARTAVAYERVQVCCVYVRICTMYVVQQCRTAENYGISFARVCGLIWSSEQWAP